MYIKIVYIACLISTFTSGFGQNQLTYLPSKLIDGRFFLKMPTITNDTIIGFCDTGGGYTVVYNKTLQKIKLESKVSEVEIEGEKTKFILAKDIFDNRYIPYPQINNYYKSFITSSFFEVPEINTETDYFSKYVPHDAFLGQFFFMNQSWTFDYLTGKIFINSPLSSDTNIENIQTLGFKKDKQGNKRFGHPSMKIIVDERTIDVLLDTGATLLLSENSKNEFNGKKAVGGSFIAKSIFDKWHTQHPDWRIIEKGEITGADLIEVPQVKVGNLVAGPVWFAKRPDEAWSKGMIGSMDKVVKGAVGGSFFQYFKITVDYNSDLVKFEK